MKEIKLTDDVIIPVMEKHNISREEAEKRLRLLYESGILVNGDPRELETQQLIDGFLAQDSEVLSETVLFEKTFSACLEKKEFVKEYDRISGRNLSKVLRLMNEGQEPSNAKKEFVKFEAFIRKTVFARLLAEIEG